MTEIKEESMEIVTQNCENFAEQIPDHVILRLARFLLPKMQKELETEKVGTFDEDETSMYDDSR